MKKYEVTLYFHTNITVLVDAENEGNAIEQARQYAARDDNDAVEMLMEGLVEDNTPDVEELK